MNRFSSIVLLASVLCLSSLLVADANIAPILAIPSNASCVENSFVDITPVLLDDVDADEHFQSYLIVNISTEHGLVAFPRGFSGIRILEGGSSNASFYSLMGKLIDMQRVMSNLRYYAPSSSALASSGWDDVKFSVTDMHQSMGAWVTDHSPLERSSRVAILNKQYVPSITGPANKIECNAGASVQFAVNFGYNGSDFSSRMFYGSISSIYGKTIVNGTAASKTSALSGTIGALNAAIEDINYTPEQHTSWLTGLEKLTISLYDTEGGAALVSSLLSITVHPVNSAPQLEAPSTAQIPENGMISITSPSGSASSSANSGLSSIAVAVAEANSEDILTIQVSAEDGVFVQWDALLAVASDLDGYGATFVSSFISTAASINFEFSDTELATMQTLAAQKYRKSLVTYFASDPSKSSNSVTLKGPETFINQALTRLVYLPPAGWHGVDKISFNVTDLSGSVITKDTSVTVLDVDNLPFMELPSANFDGTEDAELTIDGITLVDDDYNEMQWLLRLNITANHGLVAFVEDSILPGATTAGARFISGCVGDDGVSDCTANRESIIIGDPAAIQQLLADLSFIPDKDVNNKRPTHLQPSLVFGVEEYDLKTSTSMSGTTFALAHINLESVNDVPDVDGFPSYPHVLEDQASYIFQNITILDVDVDESPSTKDSVQVNVSCEFGTVKLAVNNNNNGIDFTLVSISELAIENKSSGLILTGDLSTVNFLLRQVEYQSTLDFNGEDFLTLNVSDNAVEPANFPLTIIVDAVNDVPTVTAPYILQTWKNSVYPIAGVSVYDSDFIVNAHHSALLTVTVTVASGQIMIESGQVRFEVGQNKNKESTILMSGSIYGINDALASIDYHPKTNFIGVDTITISASDRGHYGAPPTGQMPGASLVGESTINVVVKSVDSSVSSLTLVSTQGTQGNSALSANSHVGTGLNMIEIENTELFMGNIAMRITCNHCAFSFTDSVISSGVIANFGTTTSNLTLIGSLARVTAVLPSVDYVASVSYDTTDSVKVEVASVGQSISTAFDASAVLSTVSVPVSITGRCQQPTLLETYRVRLVEDTVSTGALIRQPVEAFGKTFVSDSFVDEMTCRMNVTAPTGVVTTAFPSVDSANKSVVILTTASVSGSSLSLTLTSLNIKCSAVLTALEQMTLTPGADINSLNFNTESEVIAIGVAVEVPSTGDDTTGADFDRLMASSFIYIAPRDDEPSIVSTYTSTVSGTEDVTITFTGLSVTDIDATEGVGGDEEKFTLILSVCHGSLTPAPGHYYVQSTSNSISECGTAKGSFYRLRGTIQGVNTALLGLVYTPSESWNGEDSLFVSVGGSRSSTGATTSTTISMVIEAVNDASEIRFSGNAGRVAKGFEDVPFLPFGGLEVADVDTHHLSLTALVSSGSLGFPSASALSQSQSGGSIDSSSWSNTVQINSTAADITSMLQSLMFVGPSNFNVQNGGAISAVLTVTDQFAPVAVVPKQSTVSFSIVLYPVDDAPVLIAPTSALTGTSRGVSLTGLGVTDVDSDVADVTFWLPPGMGVIKMKDGVVPAGLYFQTGENKNTAVAMSTSTDTTYSSENPVLRLRGKKTLVNYVLTNSLVFFPTEQAAESLSIKVTAANVSSLSSTEDLVNSATLMQNAVTLVSLSVVVDKSVDLTLASLEGPRITTCIEGAKSVSIQGFTLREFSNTQLLRVTLTSSSGTLSAGTSTPASVVVLEGYDNDLNTRLSTITFTPAAYFSGTVSVIAEVTLFDSPDIGVLLSRAAYVHVSPVNDPPSVVFINNINVGENGIVCSEGAECFVSVNVTDPDASDAYCPGSLSNTFEVVAKTNISMDSFALTYLQGISGFESTIGENGEVSTAKFRASALHYNGKELQLKIVIGSLSLLEAGVAFTGYLNITVNDEGNCGTGGVLTSSVQQIVTVQPKETMPSIELSNTHLVCETGSECSLPVFTVTAGNISDLNQHLKLVATAKVLYGYFVLPADIDYISDFAYNRETEITSTFIGVTPASSESDLRIVSNNYAALSNFMSNLKYVSNANFQSNWKEADQLQSSWYNSDKLLERLNVSISHDGFDMTVWNAAKLSVSTKSQPLKLSGPSTIDISADDETTGVTGNRNVFQSQLSVIDPNSMSVSVSTSASEIELTIACVQNGCSGGKLIMPFAASVRAGVKFLTTNFDQSLSSYGSSITLSGTVEGVNRALGSAEFYGILFTQESVEVSVSLSEVIITSGSSGSTITTLLEQKSISLKLAIESLFRGYKLANTQSSASASVSKRAILSLSGLSLQQTALSKISSEEIVDAVIASTSFGEVALAASSPDTTKAATSVSFAPLSRSYQIDMVGSRSDSPNVQKVEITAPHALPKQTIQLSTSNGNPPLHGDIDLSFTMYGTTETSSFNANATLVEISSRIKDTLSGLENVGKVQVEHEAPGVGASSTLYGSFHVTCLTNTGALPALVLSPSVAAGSGGVSSTVSVVQAGTLVAETQSITLTHSSALTDGTFIVVFTHGQASNAGLTVYDDMYAETSPIAHDSTDADVKTAFESVLGMGLVSVTASSSAATSKWTITFLTHGGDVPALMVLTREVPNPALPATFTGLKYANGQCPVTLCQDFAPVLPTVSVTEDTKGTCPVGGTFKLGLGTHDDEKNPFQVSLSLSLILRFKGLILYTVVVLFHVEWCIR